MDPPKPNFDTPLSGSEVAGDPWAFDVILITEGPGNPSQKYYYTQDFINDPQTSALYQGAQGYIDHDGEFDSENRPERSMKDLLCWYDQVRPEGNALKARQHIIPAEDNKFWRDVVLESIRYRSKFPEKNLCGLSIVQKGDWEQQSYNGEQWKFVKRATAVKSVDLVTLPARGGMVLKPSDGSQAQSVREAAKTWMMESMREAGIDFQKQSGQSGTPFAAFNRKDEKSKESESGTPDLMGSLTGMRDLIEAADDSMPLKKELRRGLDNAITAASNSNGGSTMPTGKEGELVIKHNPAPAATPGTDPDGMDENAITALHGKASETFHKLAEGCTDPVMKSQYQTMAEAYGGLSAPKAKASESEGKEAEGEEEAEDEGEEAEKKAKASENETESMRIERLEINDLMRESGFVGDKAAFVRESMQGRPYAERVKILKKAKSAFAQESLSTPGITPARQTATGVSAFAGKFADFNKKGGH